MIRILSRSNAQPVHAVDDVGEDRLAERHLGGALELERSRKLPSEPTGVQTETSLKSAWLAIRRAVLEQRPVAGEVDAQHLVGEAHLGAGLRRPLGQDLVEARARHLEGPGPAGGELVGEVEGEIVAAAVEGGAVLALEAGGDHRVQQARLLEEDHALRQQALADRKAWEALALEHDDLVAPPRQQRGRDRARRPRADHRDVALHGPRSRAPTPASGASSKAAVMPIVMVRPKALDRRGRRECQEAEGEDRGDRRERNGEHGGVALNPGLAKEQSVVDADAEHQQQRRDVEQADRLAEQPEQAEAGERRGERWRHHHQPAAQAIAPLEQGGHDDIGAERQRHGAAAMLAEQRREGSHLVDEVDSLAGFPERPQGRDVSHAVERHHSDQAAARGCGPEVGVALRERALPPFLEAERRLAGGSAERREIGLQQPVAEPDRIRQPLQPGGVVLEQRG